ncbi:MAG: SufE family protein [Muribaculaceae bacterium]|nr:SufE family protein [Muribaculaceae bacterium]
MTIDDKQQEIIDEFSEINDWMDRYGYIIDLGNSLPPIDESLKTPDRLIEGCQSRVWLDATVDNDGNIHFSADSDAIIVKGIISLLISVLDNHTPDEIMGADLHFIDDIGLGENLSPTRSNGLLAMIKQIKMYAMAFKAKQQS